MNPFRHRFSPKPALRLLLIITGSLFVFPTVSHAVLPTGKTTTTCVLTYVNGVQKWVMRIDPLGVQSFQLDIMFDPARCQLDQTVGINGIVYKAPFNQTSAPDFTQLGAGLIKDVAGNTATTSPGDVDIFELTFIDLHPAQPINGVPFTVFASANDSVTAFDPVTMQTVVYNSAQIVPTTRSVIPNVNPHIWDPDTLYNNGGTGGSGTWNTSSNSWDDVPLQSGSLNDTAWNNATHATDIAVFGGNPGGGIVTVAVPISVGGFQFDNSGYTIQGGTITLAAPAGFTPTIDTGENTATISSTLNGSAFTKLGTGTLTLAGTSSFTGNVIISDGTLLVNGSLGSGVSVNHGMLGGNGAVTGAVTIGDGIGSADAVLAPGTDGSIGVTSLGSLSLLSDAVYKLDLNSATVMADKIMTFGATDLSNGLALLLVSDLGSGTLPIGTMFTIIDNASTSATTGFFAGLPNGSRFTVGSNAFEIDYDVGSNGNDVQLTVVLVPESGTTSVAALFIVMVGLRHCLQRYRKAA